MIPTTRGFISNKICLKKLICFKKTLFDIVFDTLHDWRI